MSKFSVNLKIGGNWANGVTYIQQATIIADGRTLKEVEEKAIKTYCDDIIKQYGNINDLEVIYENYGKTTEATCSTCDRCACEWSITAEARRMKKDESYKYAKNYTGVRYYYNGFHIGYTQENICSIAFDPEYNKAETTEATAETTEATAETTEATAETTETKAETKAEETEATETKAEATAETTEATAQTAETRQKEGPYMKKYNINVTACVHELNTFNALTSFTTINKNYIIEAKDKEDAKQKGREQFIAETLYKGSIYGEYTGERRVAPFMERFADDLPAKYEDITRRDYFEYRWSIDVYVKQYRKPRTQTTEATAETTEATAQPKAEETEQPKAEEPTQATTEATAQTTQTAGETAQTTETTGQPEKTITMVDFISSYPNKAMLNSCYGMCVTAQTTEETAETAEATAETTETQHAEETGQPAEVTTTGATPPTEATTHPTETEAKTHYRTGRGLLSEAFKVKGGNIRMIFGRRSNGRERVTKSTPPPTEATTQPTETTTHYRTGRGILAESGRGILSEAFHRATKSTPPPPIISTRKGVNGVTIREHRQYNNGIEKIIVHKGFYNFDELIAWYQSNDPSFLCTYKGILFGCDDVDYYASSFIYESEYL